MPKLSAEYLKSPSYALWFLFLKSSMFSFMNLHRPFEFSGRTDNQWLEMLYTRQLEVLSEVLFFPHSDSHTRTSVYTSEKKITQATSLLC